MEVFTPTTTLTNSHSVVLVQLSSGNLGMISYQVDAGQLLLATLLAILVVIQGLQLWRERRR